MMFTLLGTYLLSVILLLVTPGPVVALVTHTALREGHRRAFNTIAGTSLGSLVLIAMATLLLSGAVTLHPLALPVVGLVGSLVLGWMAVDLLRHRASPAAVTRQHGGFTTGFAISVANPKDILFFAAFFPQFVGITPSFALSITLLTFIWVVMDLLIMTLWILGITRFLPQRYTRQTNLATALFLLAVAAAGLVINLRALG
ncbi:MAG: LysE family translocator [Leclercia sp.]